MFKVFISYRRKSGGDGYATLISERLKWIGAEVFLDVENRKGDNYQKVIAAALAKADLVLFLIQNDSFPDGENKTFTGEIISAMALGKPAIVVPIKMNEFTRRCLPNEGTAEELEAFDKLAYLNSASPFDISNVNDSCKHILAALPDGFPRREALIQRYEMVRRYNEYSEARVLSRGLVEKDEPTERWKEANRIDIVTVSGNAFVNRYRSTLIKKLEEGTPFRVLAYDPLSLAAKVARQYTVSERRLFHSSMFDSIKQWKELAKRFPNLSFRLTKTFITCAFQIVYSSDPSFSYIKADWVQMMGKSKKEATDVTETRCSIIYQDDPSNDFAFFESQFSQAWMEGK